KNQTALNSIYTKCHIYLMIPLDLLQFQDRLQIKTQEQKRWILDAIRKKWLVLTPEELVRQLLVCYLVEEKAYNKNRIALEKSLRVNGLLRRWDALVYNEQTHAALLIECKAPRVPVSQHTFEQIARYNLAVKVPFLLVTNGLQTYCCKIDHAQQSFQFLAEIPDPEQLNST
ncbi:MAG: type I restriction enzyme HsdR N-terminal domain-containing protein, partial [Bacteroidota bacterium]